MQTEAEDMQINAAANASEKKKFNEIKSEVLILIKDKKDFDKIENKINTMNTINNDIQNRIQYKSLKQQVNKIEITKGANEQEKTDFNQKKKDVLQNIKNEASFEDVQNNINDLNTKNKNIQNRIEQDKKYASLKEQVDIIHIVNGANATETDIFKVRKQDAYNKIKNRNTDDDINAAIAILKQTNVDIQARQIREVDQINIVGGANADETNIFTIRKQNAYNTINNGGTSEDIDAAIATLKQTNTDIQARQNREEAARQAAIQAAQQAQYTVQSSNQSGYYCVDGMYVGNANPHARGKANACYGHKGFAVNH